MSENQAQRPGYKEDQVVAALVKKAKQGEEQAFGELYERYFERIYRFIYFRVNHKEIAEDLTEDVFVKAWSKIKHVKEESFGGWVYQIAKNRIIDYYRQSKETVDITEIENILESDENIIESTNLIIEQKTFLELLKKLTPEQQIIIKLKFIEDLDNSEISELISKSEGSIRVIQHRAIQRLQELLDQHIKLQSSSKSIDNNLSNSKFNAQN